MFLMLQVLAPAVVHLFARQAVWFDLKDHVR